MDRDVQYYYPGLENTWGAKIRIHDQSVGATIATGSIAAFGEVIMRAV